MFAARMGDLGSHGDILSTGASKTFIEGKLAHRQFDNFVCPIYGSGITVSNCCLKTSVEGMPLAHINSIGVDMIPMLIATGALKTNVET